MFVRLIKNFAIYFFNLIDKFIHQRRILNFLKKKIFSIEIFIDIGAHKGKYTDLIVNNYDVYKVLMFEPQKNIFQYLKKKYKKNKRIKIFDCAVSDKNKKKELFINKHDLTSSLTELNPNNKYLSIKSKLFGTNFAGMIEKKNIIQTNRLDKIIKDQSIKKIDLIKIDTEGHELEVLQGFEKKLKSVKIIIIEFHKANIYLNYHSKKIERILKKNHFELNKTIKFPFTTWEDRIYLNTSEEKK